VKIAVAARSTALQALQPLRDAYVAEGHDVIDVQLDEREATQLSLLPALVEQADALLVVGDRRRGPRTIAAGPAVQRSDGAWVSIGWLPDTGEEALRRFASAAARVHHRSGPTSIALLGQWNPRYLRLAGRIADVLETERRELPVFRWTSDIMMREDMVRGLGSGLAAAVYVGHGRPIGWVGYRGMRSHHLAAVGGEPMGALFSLCCETASRKRTSISFSETIPLLGVAAATLGAVAKTLHTHNTRLALGLSLALARGARTIADAIAIAMLPHPEALAAYRILGDPLAPLTGAPDSAELAAAIPCYP
jgi:hypothetical protein